MGRREFNDISYTAEEKKRRLGAGDAICAERSAASYPGQAGKEGGKGGVRRHGRLPQGEVERRRLAVGETSVAITGQINSAGHIELAAQFQFLCSDLVGEIPQ